MVAQFGRAVNFEEIVEESLVGHRKALTPGPRCFVINANSRFEVCLQLMDSADASTFPRVLCMPSATSPCGLSWVPVIRPPGKDTKPPHIRQILEEYLLFAER